MLKLYHGGSSVCSAKVRVGLTEKGIDWESMPINLQSGEQLDPEYLKINPNGVVPTLIDDGFTVLESSLILEYVDSMSPENPLMPADRKQQALAKLWLLRCIEIHAAINTMTFTTVGRKQILDNQTPEQIAAGIAKMPSVKGAKKKADLIKNGLASDHVTSDFAVLKRTFADMRAALQKGPWVSGNEYGIVDAAIISYIDRLDRLAMSGLWNDYDPEISDWFARSKARPSYKTAINDYIPAEQAAKMRATGETFWPEVLKQWTAFNAS